MERFLEKLTPFERSEDINEAIGNYNPTDEARICRFTKPDGKPCYKKNCGLEHTRITKGTV